MKLDGSIAAIVTGGASGLGEACARALAETGVRVTIFDMNEANGAALASQIGGAFVKVDVTSESSVDAGFELARAAHGQERILLNCAGIAIAAKTVARDKTTGVASHFSLPGFEKVISVNLIGTARCCVKSALGMAGADLLEDGQRGVIINTASVAAVEGQIGQAAYAASKGGVVSMTLPMARDLASEGIRVNVILPGIMETPMMASMSEPVRAALALSVPFPKRLGAPAEFASLALEICRNNYLNGSAIRLDGAIRMAPR